MCVFAMGDVLAARLCHIFIFKLTKYFKPNEDVQNFKSNAALTEHFSIVLNIHLIEPCYHPSINPHLTPLTLRRLFLCRLLQSQWNLLLLVGRQAKIEDLSQSKLPYFMVVQLH